MEEFKVITQDYVNVQISTSKDSVPITEKRFQRGIKVMELKVKSNAFYSIKVVNEKFIFRTNWNY